MLAGVVVAAVATIVGVIALWPRAAGRQTAIAKADQVGLVTDRLSATVEASGHLGCCEPKRRRHAVAHPARHR